MTVTFVYFALVLKMPGVVKYDELRRMFKGFSQTDNYFYFLVRVLAKCKDLILVLTCTFTKSSS